MSDKTMIDYEIRDSPLSRFFASRQSIDSSQKSAVILSERIFLGYVNLRGETSDVSFMNAISDVLGVFVPSEPNTIVDGDFGQLIWLGPDEWLLIAEQKTESVLIKSLQNKLRDIRSAVTDVSGGQTIIRLTGASSSDVLLKGCSLDLHQRSFSTGRCAQTLVAGMGVTIIHVDDTPTFDLIVRRSLAEYLACWIEDASQEYGFGVVTNRLENE